MVLDLAMRVKANGVRGLGSGQRTVELRYGMGIGVVKGWGDFFLDVGKWRVGGSPSLDIARWYLGVVRPGMDNGVHVVDAR